MTRTRRPSRRSDHAPGSGPGPLDSAGYRYDGLAQPALRRLIIESAVPEHGTAGLAPGDDIIVNPSDSIATGTAVRILPPPPDDTVFQFD